MQIVGQQQFILKHDGKEVARGNQFDLLKYIHTHHSFSFDWALAHEGYSVEPVEPSE